MAPCKLDAFTIERLEQARRLLAEPGKHQNSTDLQARADAMGMGAEGQESPCLEGVPPLLLAWP